MNITEIFIKKNRVSNTLFLLIIVGGIFSYINFPRSEDPSFIFRQALVQTYFPGASPEKVELLVTDKIEKKIQEMPEVKYIESENRTGVSIVTVTIKEKYKDMDSIWDTLKNKVYQSEKDLPIGTSKPFVWDDYGDVFGIVLSITADGFTYKEIKEVADYLKREILLIPNVAKIDLYGEQEERIFIEISNSRLSSFGITPGQLMQLLQKENIVMPAGSIYLGLEKIIIEPTGNFQTIEDLSKIVIPSFDTHDVLYLGDISEIKRTYIDPPNSIMKTNGIVSLGLAISMAEDGNIIKLGNLIKEKIELLKKDLPIGINIEFVNFQPKQVIKATDEFMLNLLQAIFIVCLVMILSLGIRLGFIVASLIPMSILMTFCFMTIFGIDLHRVSIASLIIALGLMVDCGIVISEGILVRLQNKEDKFNACVRAGKEFFLPLLTSTLTTSVAFLPIALSKSNVGEYCISLFQVVSISLFASWFFGITMIPFLCYYFLDVNKKTILIKSKILKCLLIVILYLFCIIYAKIPYFVMLSMLPFFIIKFIIVNKKNIMLP